MMVVVEGVMGIWQRSQSIVIRNGRWDAVVVITRDADERGDN